MERGGRTFMGWIDAWRSERGGKGGPAALSWGAVSGRETETDAGLDGFIDIPPK